MKGAVSVGKKPAFLWPSLSCAVQPQTVLPSWDSILHSHRGASSGSPWHVALWTGNPSKPWACSPATDGHFARAAAQHPEGQAGHRLAHSFFNWFLRLRTDVAAEAELQRVGDQVNSSWAAKVPPGACAGRQEQRWLWVLWVVPRFRALLGGTGRAEVRRAGLPRAMRGLLTLRAVPTPGSPARAGITQFGNTYLTDKVIYSAFLFMVCCFFFFPFSCPCCTHIASLFRTFLIHWKRDFCFCLNHLCLALQKSTKGVKIIRLHRKGCFFVIN